MHTYDSVYVFLLSVAFINTLQLTGVQNVLKRIKKLFSHEFWISSNAKINYKIFGRSKL